MKYAHRDKGTAALWQKNINCVWEEANWTSPLPPPRPGYFCIFQFSTMILHYFFFFFLTIQIHFNVTSQVPLGCIIFKWEKYPNRCFG